MFKSKMLLDQEAERNEETFGSPVILRILQKKLWIKLVISKDNFSILILEKQQMCFNGTTFSHLFSAILSYLAAGYSD